MHTIGGLTPTGRKLRGPASDLVELDGNNGLKHTAIVFHPEHRQHNGINDALSVVLGFLESPMVSGIVELVGHDQPEGAFLYPTGQVWSVKEVVTALYDRGDVGGIRAGLELMYVAGEILKEASDTGAGQGVYSHGGLTPWRVMLRKDGQVNIIGYALPQVEILQFAADPSVKPQTDSFRYCPPERVVYAAEDLSSDLFSLGLIAFELMTGKPVYDGLVDEIRQQAARAEGSKRLYRFRDKLPQSVRDLLSQVLRLDQRDRFPDGNAFLAAVSRVINSSDAVGPSLLDVMSTISNMTPRAGAVVDAASTAMGSPEQFRKMLGDDDTAGDVPVRRAFSAPPPPRTAAPTPPPAPAPAPVAPAAPAAPAPTAAPPPASTENDALRRSGIRRTAPSAAAALSSSGAPLSVEEAAAPRWAGVQRRAEPAGLELAAPVISDPDAILDALSASRSRGARAPVRLRTDDEAQPAAALHTSGRFGAPQRALPAEPEPAPAAPTPTHALHTSGRFGAPARARPGDAGGDSSPRGPATSAQRILDEIVRSSGGSAAPVRPLRRAPPRTQEAADPAASFKRTGSVDELPQWAPPLPQFGGGAPVEDAPERTELEGAPLMSRSAPPPLPVAAGPAPERSRTEPPPQAAGAAAPPAPAFSAAAPPPPTLAAVVAAPPVSAVSAAAPPALAFSAAAPPALAFSAPAPPPPAFSAAAPPAPAFSAAAPPAPAFSAAAPPAPAFSAAAPPAPAFSAAAPPPPAFSAAAPPPAFSAAPPPAPAFSAAAPPAPAIAAAAPPPPAFPAAPPAPAFSAAAPTAPAVAPAAPPPPAAASTPPPPAFAAAAPPPPAFSAPAPDAPTASTPVPPMKSVAAGGSSDAGTPAARPPVSAAAQDTAPPAPHAALPPAGGARSEQAPRSAGLPIGAGPAPAAAGGPPSPAAGLRAAPHDPIDDEDEDSLADGDPHSTRLMMRPARTEADGRARLRDATPQPPADGAASSPPAASKGSMPARTDASPPVAAGGAASAPAAVSVVGVAAPTAALAGGSRAHGSTEQGPSGRAPAAPPPDPASAAVSAALTLPPVATRLDRTPDAFPVSGPPGSVAPFTVRRGPGSRPTRIRLPLAATTAEAVTWMVGNLVPVKMSLTGGLMGWYRLAGPQGRLAPDAPMSTVDTNEDLQLEYVDNTVSFCDLTVEATGVRLLTPCGSAVPVSSLVDHLCAWLGLAAGSYRLLVNDQELGVFAILADVPLPADGVHRLRLVGPR